MTEADTYPASEITNQLDLQKIAVKILTNAQPTLKLDPFIAIFGRWRAETHWAQWLDLADYAHMPRGPGIMLIGQRCNFSFDLGSAAPGLLYVNKKGLEGSPESRVRFAFRACFELSRRIMAEPEFPPEARARTGSLELNFNDRLETPNTENTDRLLRPVVASVLDGLLGPGAYEMRRQPDPLKLYGFSIEAQAPPNLDTLLSRL